MSDPIIGVITRRVDEEARPAYGADMSTLIIVGPMPGADEKAFPLNRPVRGYSNSVKFAGKMGVGFIADAVRGVNDQLGEAQFAAQIVVVRTPEGTGANDAAKLQSTLKGIVGDSLQGTGLWAGLRSADLLGVIPRLWLAPGYTGVLATSLGEITVTTRGAGYVPGQRYALTFAGGGAGAVQAAGYVEADENGDLEEPVITAYGAYFTEAPTVTVEAPPVTSSAVRGVFTATADVLANPIVANMDAVLSQYLAHGIVESSGTSAQNDQDWRETINSQRLIPLSGGVKVVDPDTGVTVVRPFAPRFAGALVRRDHETGGPFHSACNQPIRGILGPARTIPFNISQLENEGQGLLKDNIGILIRGEVGNDFAIAAGGFIVLATDNAGDDELWRFYNQTRGRDYIHIQMIRTLRFYLGKFNMTTHTVTAVVNTMEDILQKLQANENILGYRVGFAGNDNNASEIRLGHLTVNFAAEEPAPLRKITTKSSRYRPAIDAMVSQLESQLNLAA